MATTQKTELVKLKSYTATFEPMRLLKYSESRFTAGHYQSIRKATLEQQPSEDTLELSFDLSIPSVPKKIVDEMA